MNHTAARIARTALQGLLIAFVLTIPSVIAFGQTLPRVDNTKPEGLFVNHIMVGIGATGVECPAELQAQVADSFSALTCFSYGYSADIFTGDVDLHSDYNNPVSALTQMAWSTSDGDVFTGGFLLAENNVVVTYMESIDLGLFGVTLP